jgi:hypothetical protein
MLNVRPVMKPSSYLVCVQGILYPIFLKLSNLHNIYYQYVSERYI